MTEACNIIPPKPKLSSDLDVNILFKFFEKQGDDHLLDKVISQKLLILLLVFGSHMLSTIKSFTVYNMIINVLCLVFIKCFTVDNMINNVLSVLLSLISY